MDEQDPTGLEDAMPMVLRPVPPERRQLAQAMVRDATDRVAEPPDASWWELVDPATAAELPPAAVALTHAAPDGSVAVLALGARHRDATGEYAELLRVLVATLRSRSADGVTIRPAAAGLVGVLLAAGFAPVPDGEHGVRYLLAL
jgi:ABC-type Fe3+ transport system substrate-binding protein